MVSLLKLDASFYVSGMAALSHDVCIGQTMQCCLTNQNVKQVNQCQKLNQMSPIDAYNLAQVLVQPSLHSTKQTAPHILQAFEPLPELSIVLGIFNFVYACTGQGNIEFCN